MYCKHCGQEIDDNSSFCKVCGKSQAGSKKDMKPIIIAVIVCAVIAAIALILVLPRNNKVPVTKTENGAPTEQKSETKLTVSVTDNMYKGSFAREQQIIYCAEIENTSDCAISIDDVMFTAEDSNGAILATSSGFLDVYPDTVNPGETIYMCKDFDSSDIVNGKISDVDHIRLSYELKRVGERPKLEIEFSNETYYISEYGKMPSIMGEITNKMPNDVNNIYLIGVIYDTNGKMVSLMFNIEDSIKAGATETFEMCSISWNSERDYSNCSYKLVAAYMG